VAPMAAKFVIGCTAVSSIGFGISIVTVAGLIGLIAYGVFNEKF